MIKPSIDDMFAGKQSRYALVIGVAKRARQIASESEKKGEILTEKTVIMATRDFRQHKYIILEPEVNN